MKLYVVYYKDYNCTEIRTICNTQAEAEEYILAIVEETEYQDYLFKCVQYKDFSSLEEYIKYQRKAMKYYNNQLPNEGYKTLEGFDLLIKGRKYYIETVEAN